MDLVTSLGASIVAAHLVYWLRHRRRMNGIRAAGVVSLAFSGVARLTGSAPLLALEPVFFGATFCAMSEPHRLSEKRVLLAGALFALLFTALHHYGFDYVRGGIGGTLGGSAFVACLLVYLFARHDR